MLRIDPHTGVVVTSSLSVVRTSLCAVSILLLVGVVRLFGDQLQKLPEVDAYVPTSADVSSPPDMHYAMGVAEMDPILLPTSRSRRFDSFEAQGNLLVWIDGSPEITTIGPQDPSLDPIEILRWRLFLAQMMGQGQYALSFRLPFVCQGNTLRPGSARSPDGWEPVRAQWDLTEPR